MSDEDERARGMTRAMVTKLRDELLAAGMDEQATALETAADSKLGPAATKSPRDEYVMLEKELAEARRLGQPEDAILERMDEVWLAMTDEDRDERAW